MKKAKASAKAADPGAGHGTETLTLRTPGRFVYVKPVRSFVTVAADVAGFSDEQIEELGLVVTELFNNAVEYGCESAEAAVSVVCTLLPDGLRMTVSDPGRKQKVDFDALLERAALDKPVDDLEQRGRGLFLIRRLTDDMAIRSTPARGTEVTITKLR
jgi:anti-sigma regulatory factor (Ser/Thr protein kinase)